jgi:hypothetical protein
MPSYHSKSELAFHTARIDGYERALEVWKATCTDLNAHHEASVQAWQEQRDSDALTAETADPPSPPVLPHEPEAIDPASLPVYEARAVDAIEEIETPTGTIIVMPGRIVLTAPDGTSFAVSEQELAHSYSPVDEATP